MPDENERTNELIQELEHLRRRLAELPSVRAERDRAGEALKVQKANLENLIENLPEAIALLDKDDRVVRINREFTRVFGYTPEEAVGRPINDLIVPPQLIEEGVHFYRAITDGSTVDAETVRRRKDGSLVSVSVLAILIHDDEGDCQICAIYRDITERKHAEEELRRMQDQIEGMRFRLLELQENERASVARALHDSIGQSLGILDFNVTAIEEILGEAGCKQIAGLITNMRGVIRETGDKLRDIARGLHPREVQELGLVVGVRGFIDQFQRRTGLRVTTAINADGLKVDERIAINIYRIIQESFTNILKHSHSRSVDFEMREEGACLLVRIKDDGIGFSLEEVSGREIDRRGMGMFIIQERTRAINGRLEIHSSPNEGTEVALTVPLTR
jgi:two-component system, NarL family, sensor histidine kinase NreB